MRTDETINSRFDGASPIAVYFDKNTHNLELRLREYVVPDVLCEQGKGPYIVHPQNLTDITGYILDSLLTLQVTYLIPY